MLKDDRDAMESPLETPTFDPDSARRTNETERDENGRPFIVVDGRRYVLAEEEPDVDLGALPFNPKLARLPSPPREVSARAQIALLTGVGSPTASFGRVWLCFTLVFCVVFFGVAGMGTAIYERASRWEPFASAKIVSCEEANVRIDGASPMVWAFEGTAPDGSTFVGRSYAYRYAVPGTEVAVERKAGSSFVLRAEGTSISAWGDKIGASLVIIAVLVTFVLIGVLFAIVGPIRNGLKRIGLLKRGVATEGVPIDVSETGAQTNGRPEMKVTYRFRADDGNEYRVFAKTFDVDRLTDEPTEVLLYAPDKPDKTIALDALPRCVSLGKGDAFVAKPGALFGTVVFLVVLIAELVAGAYFAFRVPNAEFSIAAVAPSTDAAEENGVVAPETTEPQELPPEAK